MSSLLRMLAIRPTLVDPPRLRYDALRQVSQVWERGKWVDTWKAGRLHGTKKRDIETGEDAKGQ